MQLFGFEVPAPVFWVVVAVVVIAVVAVIAVPMYKGYKKEMEKPVKKGSGAKKSTSSAKKKTTKK